MTYLEGFEPVRFDEIKHKHNSKYHVRETFDEFIGSGHECVARTYDDPNEFARTYQSYKSFAYQNKEMGVKVSKAGNSLVLRRAR